MNIVELTQFRYSDEASGPLKLYLFDGEGYHRGALWFRRVPAAGDLSVERARSLAEAHLGRGLEVRITNAGDDLVFRADHGRVEFPANPEAFWERCGV